MLIFVKLFKELSVDFSIYKALKTETLPKYGHIIVEGYPLTTRKIGVDSCPLK
jgi:hypothetical protein